MSNTTTLPSLTDLRAGHAILTVDNGKGDHVTFKVTAPRKTTPKGGKVTDRDADIRFVSVMTGTDNETHYTYAGMLTREGDFRPTRGSKIPTTDKRVKVVMWSIRQCLKGSIPEGYSIRHAGCCLRCGRTLTNPESLDTMYGPECAGKM